MKWLKTYYEIFEGIGAKKISSDELDEIFRIANNFSAKRINMIYSRIFIFGYSFINKICLFKD